MSDVNTCRQSVLYAEREFTLSDLTSGVAFPAIYLKPGTRILRGFLEVTTAFNSGTSDTISVGDTEGTGSVNRYLVATSVRTPGLTKFTLPPLANAVIGTTEALTVTWTGVGTAATTGVARVAIEYIEENRQTEVHTYRG